MRKQLRKALRWAGIVCALGFAYLCYVYLTLPDVRALATANPHDDRLHGAAQARSGGSGPQVPDPAAVGAVQPISNNLRRAVLVAEDSAFFDHEGIDFKELQASLEANWEEGTFTRGASTITQQLAKNLYLSPSRNPIRKLKELMITRRLEAALTKRRILEIYLNVIEWGDGIFGAEAASRAYFGKPASALTPEEAALLAGAIINPREHSPARPTARLQRRQQIIVRRMGIRPPEQRRCVPARRFRLLSRPLRRPIRSRAHRVNRTPPAPPDLGTIREALTWQRRVAAVNSK